MNTDIQQLSETFKVLGDPGRLRVMHALVKACCPVCVCELVDGLELQQYQVSRHLKSLKQAGLVETQKEGTWVYYGLSSHPQVSTISQCFEKLLDDEQCREDIKNLNKRLSLRSDGKCVVGFVSANELSRLMKSTKSTGIKN